jgi:hypothetical protein
MPSDFDWALRHFERTLEKRSKEESPMKEGYDFLLLLNYMSMVKKASTPEDLVEVICAKEDIHNTIDFEAVWKHYEECSSIRGRTLQ